MVDLTSYQEIDYTQKLESPQKKVTNEGVDGQRRQITSIGVDTPVQNETEPFEEDSQETEYDPEDFSYEDSSEENPSANKEDEPLSAQFTPTPPTQAAPTEDVEILQDVLVLARRWISNSESRLNESGDREAAIERRIRAIEEHFGPDGSS
ncbi:hypothetical protein Tco_1456491 [Tanacetum coccineum]